MTETSHNQKALNRALAERIGWTVEAMEVSTAYNEKCWVWLLYTPSGEWRDNWGYQSEYSAWTAAPDYFNDPAASRELVAWLASDIARWKEFDDRLLMALSLQPPPAYDNGNAGFQRMLRQQFLTAPLPAIALAACKALGIEANQIVGLLESTTNANAFIAALDTIKLQDCQPGELIYAIKHALRIGGFLEAREIATKGVPPAGE